MAHNRTVLSLTAPVTATFQCLADFACEAGWDPGVREARLTSGAPGQVGAPLLGVAQFGPRRIPLEYGVTAGRTRAMNTRGGSCWLPTVDRSAPRHDHRAVRPPRAEVGYDAQLTGHGLGRIMDIPAHLAFQVIGRRAEAGLREELARLGAARDLEP